MDNYRESLKGNHHEENVVAGAVGALLFALVGGVLWYVLYQIGYIASISGFVGIICAMKGYSVFAKKESKKGIVISIIATVLVMVIAWYLALANDVYLAYKGWFAEGAVDYAPTFFESVRGAYVFLEDPDVAGGYFGDLAMGLFFCALGVISSVTKALKRIKAEQSAENNVDITEDAPAEAILNGGESDI